jgi:hypothetical protein
VRLSPRNIEFILAEDLRRAREAFESARANFAGVTSDIPSGIPHPDGAARVKNAGDSFQATMNAYALALREFNAFVVHGTIPDRLKEPEQPQDSARPA